MPYLKQNVKTHISQGVVPSTPGELNYAFTKIALWYLSENEKDYQKINDVIGALECCKLEFYRRLAAPYEDTKIKENGDVYP